VPNRRKYDNDLNTVMSFLADSVAQMSDSEIEEEFGNEPPPHTKELLQSALKDFDQSKLRQARARYEAARKELGQRTYNLPKTADARRSLLLELTERPDIRSVLTAQAREFHNLADSDVESFLKQLADLGLL